jgi:hypothetical protein
MKHKYLQKQLARLAGERWARRGVRLLLRAAWLGLSVWSLALGGHLLFGWPLDYPFLQALVLGCIAMGAVLLLLRPPMKPHTVARRLDHRFGLNEEMTTAIELDLEDEQRPRGIEAYLLSRAHHNTFAIQRDIRARQRLPWAEMMTLVALLVLAVGLVLMVNQHQMGNIEATPLPLPPLAAPGEIPPPQPFPPQPPANQPGNPGEPVPAPGDGVGEASYGAGNPQQAMTTLADALRDLSVTRPAAEALDRGDTTEAAQSLREVADQADQLSEETRGELADSLRDAAREMSTTHPELAGQLQNSAAGLHDPQQADRALDDLASAVEQLGPQQQQTAQGPDSPQSPAPGQAPPEGDSVPQEWDEPGQEQQQGTGMGQGSGMDQAPHNDQRERSEPSERLDVEGVPLELEHEDEDPDHTTVEGDGEQGEAPPPDSAAGSGQLEQSRGTLDETEVQAGEDPLRIPMDLRDVVQEYFSPPR